MLYMNNRKNVLDQTGARTHTAALSITSVTKFDNDENIKCLWIVNYRKATEIKTESGDYPGQFDYCSPH